MPPIKLCILHDWAICERNDFDWCNNISFTLQIAFSFCAQPPNSCGYYPHYWPWLPVPVCVIAGNKWHHFPISNKQTKMTKTFMMKTIQASYPDGFSSSYEQQTANQHMKLFVRQHFTFIAPFDKSTNGNYAFYLSVCNMPTEFSVRCKKSFWSKCRLAAFEEFLAYLQPK